MIEERCISSETRDSSKGSGENLHRKNGKETLTVKDVGTEKSEICSKEKVLNATKNMDRKYG